MGSKRQRSMKQSACSHANVTSIKNTMQVGLRSKEDRKKNVLQKFAMKIHSACKTTRTKCFLDKI